MVICIVQQLVLPDVVVHLKHIIVNIFMLSKRNNLSNRQNRKTQLGYTLIELLLYVALVGIFITGAITFAWDSIYAREKASNMQKVEQEARMAMQRIGYEIRKANSVELIELSRISLVQNGRVVEISLNNGAIYITDEGQYRITSNEIEVNQLVFTRLSETNDSISLGVTLSVKQAGGMVSKSLDAQTEIRESFELISAFNEARKMSVDVSMSTLTNSLVLGEIILGNVSSSEIYIDKLLISWANVDATRRLVSVQIGQGELEFSGSVPLGTEIDITNYALTPLIENVPMELAFNSDMENAVIKMKLIMSDGSSSKASFGSVTGETIPSISPSPTNTPTPTPISSVNSCNEFCTNGGYSAGTCRKKERDCSTNSEIYQSGGDVYCPASSSLCCCVP